MYIFLKLNEIIFIIKFLVLYILLLIIIIVIIIIMRHDLILNFIAKSLQPVINVHSSLYANVIMVF